jgi:hypothetical protein
MFAGLQRQAPSLERLPYKISPPIDRLAVRTFAGGAKG